MRKGVTLIELILVLSIMSIIASLSFISINYYKTIKNKTDSDYYCNAVVSFINNSKIYCRENACFATVAFDIGRNEMRLHKGIISIKEMKFKDKVTIYKVNGRRVNKDILIDKNGYSNDSFTLVLMDNNSIMHEISMRVGTGYVKINK